MEEGNLTSNITQPVPFGLLTDACEEGLRDRVNVAPLHVTGYEMIRRPLRDATDNLVSEEAPGGCAILVNPMR